MAIALAVAALLLAFVGGFYPPVVALNPWIGLPAFYHMRLIRRILNVSALGMATAGAILAPSGWTIAALALTTLLFGVSLRLEPTAVLTALDTPEHVGAGEAALGDEAMVYGHAGASQACAWPLEMLIPRHIINDEIDGQPLLAGY